MAEETNMTKTKTNKQMSFMLPIIAKTVTNYSNLQRNIERNVEQKYWKVIKRESDQHLTSPDNVYTSQFPHHAAHLRSGGHEYWTLHTRIAF